MRRVSIRHALPLLCLALGCTTHERSTGSEQIVWRLVDWPSVEASPAPPYGRRPEGVALAAAPFTDRGPSRAIIKGDQRYTFRRPEFTLVFRDQAFQVPNTEQFAVDVALPRDLCECQALTAEVTLTSLETSIVHRRVGRCTGPRGAEHLQFEVPSPAALRGTAVDFWVHARRTLPQGIRQRRFTIPAVPDGARLVFAYGVESPGWEPGASAVSFHVLIEDNPKPLFSARLDPASNASQRRWFQASVDLSRYAGRRLPLILQTSLDRDDDRLPFSRPVWGDPTVLATRPTSTTDRPNVILVSIDTLRARSIGAYGRQRPTTPFLDEVARGGVLFTQAVAQSVTTQQSHMSLFTALYPSTHGVTDGASGRGLDGHRTLAEILRENGYATGAVTENGLLEAARGFERGFDVYAENKTADLEPTAGHVESTFRRATEWLSAGRDVPFFLFVHTDEADGPHSPPSPYAGMFGPMNVAGSDATLDRYEEEIRYTDDQLARFWNSVERLGLADHTILIVLADHGEEFGEHGLLDHGSHLYDETLLVPLVMRAPGLLPSGVRVDAQVGLIDVVPTLLDLLGLPAIPEAQGQSVAAVLRDDAVARDHLVHELDERELFAEAWGTTRLRTDGSVDHDWHPPAYAIRSRNLKVIYDPTNTPDVPTGGVFAFHLGTDPLERNRGMVADGPREMLVHYAGAGGRPQAVEPAVLPLAASATAERYFIEP
jgi:arylsulfatase